jgi:hypothetical protein
MNLKSIAILSSISLGASLVLHVIQFNNYQQLSQNYDSLYSKMVDEVKQNTRVVENRTTGHIKTSSGIQSSTSTQVVTGTVKVICDTIDSVSMHCPLPIENSNLPDEAYVHIQSTVKGY